MSAQLRESESKEIESPKTGWDWRWSAPDHVYKDRDDNHRAGRKISPTAAWDSPPWCLAHGRLVIHHVASHVTGTGWGPCVASVHLTHLTQMIDSVITLLKSLELRVCPPVPIFHYEEEWNLPPGLGSVCCWAWNKCKSNVMRVGNRFCKRP